MTPELHLFGGVSLLAADGQLVSGAAAQPRRTAVLAVLADAWPAAVTRDRMIGLIWAEQDEAGARRLLTQALYELRRELGDVTRAAGRDVALDADALRVDLIEFRRALREGDEERAAALYRGPFLDGVYLRGAAEFERWAATVRDGAQRDLQRVLDAAVTRHERAGNAREAARWGERLLQASPFDAGAVVRCMELSERAGDPGAALRVVADYERRIREELELEPDPAVRRRADEIRALGTIVTEPPVACAEVPVREAGPAVAAVSVAPPANERDAAARDVGPVPAPVGDDALTATRPRRTARRATLVAAGIALVALAGARSMDGLVGVEGPRVVALRGFESRGDAGSEPLAPAVTAMLVSTLDGSGGARLDSTAGGASGTWGTLSGSIVATGGQLRLDAELRTAGVSPRTRRASVSGSRDSLIALTERLSLQLLPAFYPELDEGLGSRMARRFDRVPLLRRYLEGEAALHRGAFEDAYDAFRAVTEMDSTAAYAWYRRAVAAEDAHRVADADRSAALARAGAARLGERERALVHAYATWRAGEGWQAESLYRRIVEGQPTDPEAWFQFAEVAYHGGPLMGRPLDAARDSWRHAVALDSNSFPALMHAVRLEARAGNSTALHALLARADAIGAREPFVSEARAIAGYAGLATPTAVARMLAGMPDASVHFVHAIVAGFMERPELARDAASLLTAPHRPDAVRADGHVALAHLALARGEWQQASAALDSVARLNPVAAAWWRSYFATLPFLPPDPAVIGDAMRQLAAAPSHATAAPLYLELAVDAPAAEVIERYNRAMLHLATAQPAADTPALGCASAADRNTRDLCDDLERGVAAERARRDGRPADALRELEGMSMRVPYQLAGRSVYFARTRERFLRAQLLEQAGRLDEAYDWYAATPNGSRLDYIYLAPAHLARGRIRERQGNRTAAAEHYRRVLELWATPDAGLASLRQQATDGLRRVGATG